MATAFWCLAGEREGESPSPLRLSVLSRGRGLMVAVDYRVWV
jgi:hypothetical protein